MPFLLNEKENIGSSFSGGGGVGAGRAGAFLMGCKLLLFEPWVVFVFLTDFNEEVSLSVCLLLA